MYIIKRDGKQQEVRFDSITKRIRNLCDGLDSKFVDPIAVTQNALSRDPLRATFAPTFESTEHYILVLAALEDNVAKYEALSANIAATVKRVRAFNEALGENDPRAHKYV